MDDLAKRAERLCNFLDFVANETGHTPLLAGYSNGAIIAAETIRQNRESSKGAILLRPLSPCPDRNFPPLAGYPALLIAAENDQRREPSDAPYLAGQLEKAGADIVLRVVAGDHGWADDGADIRICKHWLHDHYKG
jgi:phospholipase/carboxylesterase